MDNITLIQNNIKYIKSCLSNTKDCEAMQLMLGCDLLKAEAELNQAMVDSYNDQSINGFKFGLRTPLNPDQLRDLARDEGLKS